MPDLIPFNDLARVNGPLHREFSQALDRVMKSGAYLRGCETAAFEEEWAAYCGQRHAVVCNSGTDALSLAGIALGMESAAVPANTLPLTAIGLNNGRVAVRVVDVDEDGHLARVDADAVPVLLFGRTPSTAEAGARIFDAAHAHGWQPPAGAVATWSFYPTKTLGALGDAGAVTTDDATMAERMRELRGSDDRLHHVRQLTSRMDEVQAAFLRIKLRHLGTCLADRARVAARYDRSFAALGITLPGPSMHHLYVIRVEKRDELQSRLAQQGIGCKAHWPQSLDQLRGPWAAPGEGCPSARSWAQRVLSLPCYPGLSEAEIDRVIAAVLQFCDGVRDSNRVPCCP